ncbi:MAG: hypothetical protein M0009_14895 [Deltaproteobacteria bacterium]|nr:hypothetical protein [Deltaproteobacteria bacterium]
MKRTCGFCLLALAFGFFCLGGVLEKDASAADQNPCAEDIAKFCTNSAPGPAGMAALMECFETHEKELSAPCRDFEAKMGGARMERSEAINDKRLFRERCLGDMTKFCSDSTPTQGAMLNCLNDHEGELSDPCRQSLRELR